MATMIVRFLTMNRVGRRLVEIVHPRIHPGIRAYTIAEYGCPLCRFMWREIRKGMPSEAFQDHSSIKVSEPEYNEDGSVKKYGVSMSATVQRQIDALVANDPELKQKLEEAINNIASDTKKEK